MKTPRILAAGSASINMTPMIDVVFLLIIFFLVSSHLARRENHVPLDLPLAESGQEELVERDSIVVNILKDGSWQIAGDKVSQTELLEIFNREVLRVQQPIRLRIRTDAQVEYAQIEPVLQAASRAGIGDIVFAVFDGPGA